MSKSDEGRIAGHHITPGLGWRWQAFGGKLMLVSDGGADIVLSASQMGRDRPPALVTCSPDGRVVAVGDNHPLALVLATVPDMVEALRDIRHFNDRPRQILMVEDALRKAGLA